MELTNGWGADVVFEASGSPKAYEDIRENVRPGGCIVAIGAPVELVGVDIAAWGAKEIRLETVFRYVNNFERTLDIIASTESVP
jgi:D-xylulose reductase